MWFLTLQQLQITQQVWSSCEHEYVLSCQVDRTPWPPAALSVPRAVERSCPEPLHPQTHTPDIYFLRHTIKTPPSLLVLLVWSGAQNCLQTFFYYQWNATTQGHLSTTTSTTTITTTTTHLCCFCTCESTSNLPSTKWRDARVPTGRGPGYTARRSLMRRQDVTAVRIPESGKRPFVHPFLHITTWPPRHVPFLLLSDHSVCLAIRAPCPLFACRVSVLLVESVLLGFPPLLLVLVLAIAARSQRAAGLCSLRFVHPFQSAAAAALAAAAAPAAALRGSASSLPIRRPGFLCAGLDVVGARTCGNLWLRGEHRSSSRNRPVEYGMMALLLPLLLLPREILWTHYSEDDPPSGGLGAFARGCRTVKWMRRLEWGVRFSRAGKWFD